ncbi:STAS/SEC14 domain-containing protein [Xanthobacter autotrophicus DSM 431]|uniref:STAS/SEC14 domain-containing protein n=1 Tax=Xanthobacter nonsaccharivorans TaxID=3119912 RepID=UPI00372B3C0F
MIELLGGFPADAVAFRGSGFLTKEDYDRVLVPAVEEALKTHEGVKVYYEIASDFSGMSPAAMWEDFRVGMQHLSRWKRVAVVTDVPWIGQMVQMFGFMIPVTIRVFAIADAAEARVWLGQDS